MNDAAPSVLLADAPKAGKKYFLRYSFGQFEVCAITDKGEEQIIASAPSLNEVFRLARNHCFDKLIIPLEVAS